MALGSSMRPCGDFRTSYASDMTLFATPVTRYLAFAPVDGRLWEQATPEDIISHPALRSLRAQPQYAISPVDDQTDTYLFRTQQGTIGILRVVEFEPGSRQLKIQYKLARLGTRIDA